MPDPRWSVEFVVLDSKTGARREVRIEAPELAVAGIQAVIGSEVNRGIQRLGGHMPPGFFGSSVTDCNSDPVSSAADLPNAPAEPFKEAR